MKPLVILFFLIFPLTLKAQKKFIGHYQDYFGNHIDIKLDSTFKYTWNFDMISRWNIGTWKTNNDTIYFKIIPVYDTLRYMNGDIIVHDSLVLAIYERPQMRTLSPENLGGINSPYQSSDTYPQKLFYGKDRLFNIDKNGKLIREKEKAFWTGKKYKPWYMKKYDN